MSPGPGDGTTAAPDDYWQSYQPGSGRRAPRADQLTDAPTLSLSGTWRFRLAPTAQGTGTGFLEDDFDDSSWDAVTVPGHWVLQRVTPLAGGPPRSLLGSPEGPLYTNTALPVPIDPPRVPTHNPTGDHRLVFDVPPGWGRAVLRFQGVDSCARVWLNGTELGFSTGSRLPFELDAPVRAGRNVLAVRVHRWSSGTYLEDQDMWWLPGIFRDVELLARPRAAIDDHTVRADYDARTGRGTLRVDAVVEDGEVAVVEVPELGITVPAGQEVTLRVQPWSAETPHLYRGTLRTSGETVQLAVGFRRVAVVDGVLTANGRPLRFHGVNRHEHHPDTGRTLDRETMVRDVLLMKRHNIDAVRTSHYPPHPEFLRLCDEYGLWVVEECDLETHGFIYAGWEGNPPAEPAWLPAMLDRLRRMVERDKNHPSVVVWSLANESWTGENFGVLRRWLEDRDPSRPVLYERDPSHRDSDLAACMYPSLELLEQIGRRTEPRPDGVSDDDDARRRTLPFLLVEYAHAMGNGPGGLQDYQRILDAHERFCGGFVWEWIDHGFTLPDDGDGPTLLHGGGVDHRPNGGRYCLDGLLFADRTPSPGLAELAKAYQPVVVDVTDHVAVRSRRHVRSTADHAYRWRVEVDGEPVGRGELDVPALAPGQEAVVPIPPAAAAAASAAAVAMAGGEAGGEAWLTVEVVLPDATAWSPPGHVVAWAQGRLGTPASPSRAPARVRSAAAAPGPAPARPAAGARPRTSEAGVPATVRIGDCELDGGTGALVRLGDVRIDGPVVDLYRAPTENDRGQGGANDLAGVWGAVGLDRMQQRTDAVRVGDRSVRVEGRVQAAAHPHALDYVGVWTVTDGGVDLEVDVDFRGPWSHTPFRDRDIVVPRLGLRFRLPGGYRDVTWFGRGPGESYVDSCAAARVGRFASTIDALQVAYPVPQENGNHVGTRWLELRGNGLATLRVEGAPVFDFTARRWTSQALERARHPGGLSDSGSVWLNVDHRQQGLGSASVGPALPERYRVPRERTTWRVRLVARPPGDAWSA